MGELSLAGNKDIARPLGAGAVTLLAALLKHIGGECTALDVSCNPFKDDGAKALASGLAELPKMKKLVAYGCGIDLAGATALQKACGFEIVLGGGETPRVYAGEGRKPEEGVSPLEVPVMITLTSTCGVHTWLHAPIAETQVRGMAETAKADKGAAATYGDLNEALGVTYSGAYGDKSPLPPGYILPAFRTLTKEKLVQMHSVHEELVKKSQAKLDTSRDSKGRMPTEVMAELALRQTELARLGVPTTLGVFTPENMEPDKWTLTSARDDPGFEDGAKVYRNMTTGKVRAEEPPPPLIRTWDKAAQDRKAQLAADLDETIEAKRPIAIERDGEGSVKLVDSPLVDDSAIRALFAELVDVLPKRKPSAESSVFSSATRSADAIKFLETSVAEAQGQWLVDGHAPRYVMPSGWEKAWSGASEGVASTVTLFVTSCPASLHVRSAIERMDVVLSCFLKLPHRVVDLATLTHSQRVAVAPAFVPAVRMGTRDFDVVELEDFGNQTDESVAAVREVHATAPPELPDASAILPAVDESHAGVNAAHTCAASACFLNRCVQAPCADPAELKVPLAELRALHSHFERRARVHTHLDAANLEAYLSDAEFEQVFGTSRDAMQKALAAGGDEHSKAYRTLLKGKFTGRLFPWTMSLADQRALLVANGEEEAAAKGQGM